MRTSMYRSEVLMLALFRSYRVAENQFVPMAGGNLGWGALSLPASNLVKPLRGAYNVATRRFSVFAEVARRQ